MHLHTYDLTSAGGTSYHEFGDVLKIFVHVPKISNILVHVE